MYTKIIIILIVLIIFFFIKNYSISINKKKKENFVNEDKYKTEPNKNQNKLNKNQNKLNKNIIYDSNKAIDFENIVKIEYYDSELIYITYSKFQKIEVFNSHHFGNILHIDNCLQLTEKDECNYHEMMTHVALNYIPNCQKVLVIGAGDGGICREVFKHPNITEVVQVEIDEEVIEVCKKYFPNLAVSYKDKRLKLVIDDGYAWLNSNIEKYRNYFDAVLIDQSDTDMASTLNKDLFYQNLNKITKHNGIIIRNYKSLGWYDIDVKKDINKHIASKIFNNYYVYQLFQPTYYSGHYSIAFLSQGINPKNTPINWETFFDKNIDCKYYTPDIHTNAFNLPNRFIKYEVGDPLGTTLQIDIINVNSGKLDDMDLLKGFLDNVIETHKVTKLNSVEHKFQPQGATIVYLLAESHLSIHTWPEKNAAAIDFFTCGKYDFNIDSDTNIINLIKKHFKIGQKDIKLRHMRRNI